ncbi:hypothetical protein HMPREF1584_00014 [Gardnerella vaginalis JCP8481A]|nr:hypothetical protein HMPREF1585_01357 [Gardnerella vaginalis JCP8481B]EPI44960.1 hypothetical protein HMPREF1584_00014 [Gardnerella vaginalis JCP8481A]
MYRIRDDLLERVIRANAFLFFRYWCSWLSARVTNIDVFSLLAQYGFCARV